MYSRYTCSTGRGVIMDLYIHVPDVQNSREAKPATFFDTKEARR